MGEPEAPAGDWLSQLPRAPGETDATEWIQSPANGQWYEVPKAPPDWQPPPTPPPEPDKPSWIGQQASDFVGAIHPSQMLHEGTLANVGRTVDRLVPNVDLHSPVGQGMRLPIVAGTLLRHLLPIGVATDIAENRRSLIPETDAQIAAREAQPQGYQAPTWEGVKKGASEIGPGLMDFGKGLITQPGATLGGLVEAAGERPETLLPVGDLGLPATLAKAGESAARAARLGDAAAVTAKALGHVAGDVTSFGGLMAGSEAVHELGETGNIDPEQFTSTVGQGALLGPVMGVLQKSLLKPTIRNTFETLMRGRMGEGGEGEPGTAVTTGGPPEAPPGGSGTTFDGETGEPISRADGTLPEPSVTHGLGTLVKMAQDAGVDHEDIQPIMSARLRKQISDQDAREQMHQLIVDAQAAKPKGAPASEPTPTAAPAAGEAAAVATNKPTEKQPEPPAAARPGSDAGQPAEAGTAVSAPTHVPDERGVVTTEVAGQPVAVNVQPTELQRASGNYQKGHVDVQGIPVTIENPKGTERSGVAPDGSKWTSTLQHDYGYIKRTTGADGDHVDAFIGPNPDSSKVFVIDQHEAFGKPGKFDEHKALLGFDSKLAALQGYKSNYQNGADNARHVTEMSVDQFKDWLKNGDTRAPVHGQELAASNTPSVEAPSGAATVSAAPVAQPKEPALPEPAPVTANTPPAAAPTLREKITSKQAANVPVGPRGELTGAHVRARRKADKAFKTAFESPSGANTPHPESESATHFLQGYEDSVAGLPLDESKVTKPTAEMRPHGFNPVDSYRSGYESHQTGKPVARRALEQQAEPAAEPANRAGDRELALEHVRRQIEAGARNPLQVSAGMHSGHTFQTGAPLVKKGHVMVDGPNGSEFNIKRLFDEAKSTAMATIEPEVPKRDTRKPDSREDSVLQFLAKHSKGLDSEQAAKEGIDPADMNLPQAKVGIRRAFRKGGMTFDQAAELLNEAGYPVGDGKGSYDANKVLELIDSELRGKPVHSHHNTRMAIEDEARAREAELRSDMETAAPEFASEPQTHQDMTVLADIARQHDEDATDAALESQGSDEEVAAKLRDIIAAGHEHAAEQVPERARSGEALPGEAGRAPGFELERQKAPVERQAAPVATQADAFGANPIAQAIHDRMLERDAARNGGGRQVDAGVGGGMFSSELRQGDLTDGKRIVGGEGGSDVRRAEQAAERAGEEGDASQSVGAEAVRAERAGEESDAGGAGESARGQGGAAGRSTELSGAGPAAGGESSDQPIYNDEAGFGTASLFPGDNERGGSAASGAEPSADDLERESAARGNVAAARTSESLEKKRARQRAAESIPVEYADQANAAATLPFLLPQQVEDVVDAERRFSKPDGYGKLFTNGTGTGKTYLALGAIKRMVRQGKGEGIIMVPSQKIATDWMRSAADLGLKLNLLEDTQDAGKGVSITTYANAGMNRKLADRPYDFIAADEAHSLMQNAQADTTAALDVVRALSLHPKGAFKRATMLHRKEYDDYSELAKEVSSLQKRRLAVPDELIEKLDKARKIWSQLVDDVANDVNARQGDKRPRALFLSATPFAYEKNVQWAEGFLFDYPGVAREGGYNQPDPYEAFMMQHFGYRMRYGKLTEPENEVDRDLMQRQFNTWLRKEGALSARILDVDKDYDRKFVQLESNVGKTIDEGLDWIRNAEGRKYSELYSAISKKFDYLARSRLLEALKAREAIPYIKKQMALGRKIVVFYDYNEGGGYNIFDIHPPTGEDEQSRKLATLISDFRAARPDLVRLDTTAPSPLQTLTKAFPQATQFNGLISAKKRTQYVDAFNSDDAPGSNLILAQKAANAGWSAHDTTGKHPRVLINLGLPTAPTVAIQQEGRIYRVGQASDAMFRYFNTGTNWERTAFASTIARRASTAENLAMGEEARGLRDAFIEAFENADAEVPSRNDGKGGKVRDRALVMALSDFDRAKAFYFGQQKKTSRTKAQEGTDYFATPEPLGQKMVEWAGIRPKDDLLEPSAGHGAIARWFPERNNRTVVEPSNELASRLALVTDAKLLNERFEDMHVVNKFDAIVMNPPFGSGGRTAIDHLELAASHLREGGRIVALIPEGPAADAKFAKWYEGVEGLHLVAEYGLPNIAFVRAGTSVKARVVILDKVSAANGKGVTLDQRSRHELNADSIKDFFERIKDVEGPSRPVLPTITRSVSNTEAARGEEVAGNAPAASTDFEAVNSKHTRTNADAFYAVPKKRVSRDQYLRIAAIAKRHGGHWSSFTGGGNKPGFLFTDLIDRDAFMAQVAGEKAPTLREVSYARKPTLSLRDRTDPSVYAFLKKIGETFKGVADVMVHSTTKQFGDVIGMDVPQDVYGAYTDDGEKPILHFIASNLPNIQAVQAILRHEAFGHLAMEKSPDFEKALAMVGRLVQMGGAKIMSQWREIEHAYPNASEVTKRKELIAFMAERGVKNAIVDRAITGVLQTLRKMGIGAEPSEAELRQMIVRAARGLPEAARRLSGIDRNHAYEVERYLHKGEDGKAQDAMGKVLPESEAIEALAYARRHGDSHAINVLKEVSADSPGDVPIGAPEPDEEDAFHPAEAAIPKGILFARHAPMDSAAKAAKDKVMPGDGRDNLSLRDRVRLGLKALWNFDGLAVRQSWVDDMASLERWERMMNGGKYLPGEQSPLKAARSVRNLASQMAAVLEKGIPVHKDGALHVAPGRKGLNAILAPLNENPSGSLVTHFELYAAARRASRLINETNRDGTLREKNFTQTEIQAGLALANKYPELAKVFDDLQVMWKQLLDLGEAAGTIDPAARAIYDKHDYVPFYRLEGLLAGDRPSGGRSKGGIANQREMSGRLTGKAAPLRNVLENILMNVANQIDAAQKNIANQKVLDTYQGVFAERVPKDIEAVKVSNDQLERAMKAMGMTLDPGMTAEQREAWTTFFRRVAPTDRDVVRVMRKGKPEYHRVSDPLVLDAITSIQGSPKWLRDLDKHGILSGPKRFYTAMSTATPLYTARRFVRVMMDTWMQSNHKLRLVKNAHKDFYDAIVGHKDLYDMMMAGAGGAQGYDADPERVRSMLIKSYKAGNKQAFVLRAANPKTWWDTWLKIQNASKNEHMLRVYRAARTQGASVAEAAFRARDIEDLSMHGGGAIMQFINRSVPFLNPRVQGTYRMVRGFQDNWKAYALRGAAVTMGTLGLQAHNWSDPRYQALPQWEKDVAWHLYIGDHHFMLPKPFELGLIFATMPERLVAAGMHAAGQEGGDTPGQSAEAAKRAILDTFALDPIPQVARPFLEQATNTDAFGKTIVSASLSNVQPQDQYTPWTSPTVRTIASSLPGDFNYTLNSPVRLQALIQSISGSLGLNIVEGADVLTRRALGYGDAPSTPLLAGAVKSFYQSGEPNTTKYTDELYDFMNQADKAYASVTKAANEGRMERAAEILQDKAKILELRTTLNNLGKAMRENSKQAAMVARSPDLTADEKQRALAQLTKTRNELAAQVAPFEDFF